MKELHKIMKHLEATHSYKQITRNKICNSKTLRAMTFKIIIEGWLTMMGSYFALQIQKNQKALLKFQVLFK